MLHKYRKKRHLREKELKKKESNLYFKGVIFHFALNPYNIMRRYYFPYAFSIWLMVAFFSINSVFAQSSKPKATEINYGNGIGGAITLNNSGFGASFFILKSVSKTTSLTADVAIKSEHDENEEKVYDYFGRSFIPNKYQYMLVLPLRVGFQKRLFADEIEESFRPYIQASVGPSLAWLSPYFNDANKNQIWECNNSYCEDTYDSIGSIGKGKAEVGVGGNLAVGIGFGRSRKSMQAVQVGYSFDVYPKAVQLMEPAFQGGKKFFGTPTIGIIFGRLR
jgi:hypothetical protein